MEKGLEQRPGSSSAIVRRYDVSEDPSVMITQLIYSYGLILTKGHMNM